MKSMFVAFAACALIATAANYGLDYAGFGADQRTISADVRLD